VIAVVYSNCCRMVIKRAEPLLLIYHAPTHSLRPRKPLCTHWNLAFLDSISSPAVASVAVSTRFVTTCKQHSVSLECVLAPPRYHCHTEYVKPIKTALLVHTPVMAKKGGGRKGLHGCLVHELNELVNTYKGVTQN
jgi:hypothetical protein